MNILETIYYSQYYELKNSGRNPQKGRLNGTLLCAAIIIINIISIITLLFKFAPQSGMALWLKHFFIGYENSGKVIGKLLGLVLMVVIGGLLNYTIGSEKSYNKIAEKYSALPDEVQKKTIKQSLYVFLISFVFLLLLLFIF